MATSPVEDCLKFSGQICWCGEIGRRKGLKIPWWKHRVGSSPTASTTKPYGFDI